MHKQYLVRSDDLDVVIWWDRSLTTYVCRVTDNDTGCIVDQWEYEQPQACIDKAQEFCEQSLKSIWLWRLVANQSTPWVAPVVSTSPYEESVPCEKSRSVCPTCRQRLTL